MSKMNDPLLLETVNEIHCALAMAKENGAHRFDPARFHYIESMASKASGYREPVKKIVEEKAVEALRDYWRCFTRDRTDAELIVERVTEKFPDSTEQAQRQFERGEFRQLRQLQDLLQRSSNTGLLSSLNNQFVQAIAIPYKHHEDVSFDDILRQQEKNTVESLSESGHDTGLPAELRELKSTRRFRKSRDKLGAHKLVTLAIEEGPENSGPLNPQRLVIRSLSAMRELSPQYLNRFVAYIDTLLWLEQVDDGAS